MARLNTNSRLLSLLLAGGMATGVSLTAAAPLRADDETPAWQVNESNDTSLNNDAPAQAANSGPVRLARFSYVSGNVTWRLNEGGEWSQSNINLPLRQGAQVWVTEGGRGEIQFDDGSVLRMGSGALVTLQTLYSDAEGEFTEIRVNEGLVSLSLRHERSIYQLDTPLVSLKANGPGQVRLGVGDGVEVAVRTGRATVEGAQGKVTLDGGSYLDLHDANSALETRALPRADNWDRWNDDRDRLLFDDGGRESKRYLPSNIAIVAGDLMTPARGATMPNMDTSGVRESPIGLASVPLWTLDLGQPVRMDLGIRRIVGLGSLSLRNLDFTSVWMGLGSRSRLPVLESGGGSLLGVRRSGRLVSIGSRRGTLSGQPGNRLRQRGLVTLFLHRASGSLLSGLQRLLCGASLQQRLSQSRHLRYQCVQ